MKLPLALAGVATLAAAIVLFNLLLPSGDHSFIQTACGFVRVPPGELPLTLAIDDSIVDLEPDIAAAVRRWEELAGGDLFDVRHVVSGEAAVFARAVSGTGPDPKGVVLAAAADVPGLGDVPEDPHARVRWNPASCAIGWGVIRFPATLANPDLRRRAIEHELGHALGLAHDEIESSVMAPNGGRVGAKPTDADGRRFFSSLR